MTWCGGDLLAAVKNSFCISSVNPPKMGGAREGSSEEFGDYGFDVFAVEAEGCLRLNHPYFNSSSGPRDRERCVVFIVIY